MNKVSTINLQGKEYATVPARLKRFREENPHAKITSTPHRNEDGSLDFETTIVKDQSDEFSAIGNGWAHYSAKELSNPKAFEKLQTISKGRALADIGYLNDGDIATTEEMEEFYEHQEAKKRTELEALEKKLRSAKSIDELKKAFMELSGEQKAALNTVKEEAKSKLGVASEANKTTAK